MNKFVSLLRMITVMAFCQSAAAGNLITKDLRQAAFADAVREVEILLSSQSSNLGVKQFDLRFIGIADASVDACSPQGYQQVSIAEAYEFAGVASNFPFGQVRVEIMGADGNNVKSELLVLVDKQLDSLPVSSATFKDYSSLDYTTASSSFIDNYLGWYEKNRVVDHYTLTYKDPVTGAVKTLTASVNTDLRGQLDALPAGAYEFKLEAVFDDGKVSSRFIAMNKLAVDVVPNTVDLQLAWNLPTQREDGSVLATQDIAGYEVYMTMIDSNNVATDQVLSVDGAAQTSLLLPDLSTGQYHLAISAVDSNGLKSQLSDVVTYTVN